MNIIKWLKLGTSGEKKIVVSACPFEGSVKQYYHIVSPFLNFIFSLSVTHCFLIIIIFIFYCYYRHWWGENFHDIESSFFSRKRLFIIIIIFFFSRVPYTYTYLILLYVTYTFTLWSCRWWTCSSGNLTDHKSKLKLKE